MFYRNIALTFALTLVTALAFAAITSGPGAQAETAVYTKRQDRLVPAGGFVQQPGQTGYGVDITRAR
ncbi:MAG: hypothetical protein O9322_02860 [Beijerinckiaceae bacterium]|nr:hypothetical protein [Beijerinckiaceae bacterium]MCZ8301505.1 hypothetical protein [Beijerinckiaceae bacterium]